MQCNNDPYATWISYSTGRLSEIEIGIPPNPRLSPCWETKHRTPGYPNVRNASFHSIEMHECFPSMGRFVPAFVDGFASSSVNGFAPPSDDGTKQSSGWWWNGRHCWAANVPTIESIHRPRKLLQIVVVTTLHTR